MPRPLVILSLTLALIAAATSVATGRLASRAGRADARQSARTSQRMHEAQVVALLEYAGDAAMKELTVLLDDHTAERARRDARDRLSLALARFDDAVRAWRKIPHAGDLSAAFAALEPRLAAWRAAVEAAVQAEVQRSAVAAGAGAEGVSAPPSRSTLLAAAQAAAAPMERGVDMLKRGTPAPWRDARPVAVTSGRAIYLELAWASGLAALALLGAAVLLARRRRADAAAAKLKIAA